MQIRFHLWGAGLAIPRTKIGISALMGAAVSLRNSDKASVNTFMMGDGFNVGGSSGSLLVSSVDTKWFNVDVSSNPWVSDCEFALGKTAEIILHGTIAGTGHIDVTFSLIDTDGIKTELLKRHNIRAKGYQITETKVSGNLQKATRDCTLVLATA